jgi:hypothetical protein
VELPEDVVVDVEELPVDVEDAEDPVEGPAVVPVEELAEEPRSSSRSTVTRVSSLPAPRRTCW